MNERGQIYKKNVQGIIRTRPTPCPNKVQLQNDMCATTGQVTLQSGSGGQRMVNGWSTGVHGDQYLKGGLYKGAIGRPPTGRNEVHIHIYIYIIYS